MSRVIDLRFVAVYQQQSAWWYAEARYDHARGNLANAVRCQHRAAKLSARGRELRDDPAAAATLHVCGGGR